MKTDQHLDKNQIKQIIEEEYKIKILEFEFLPFGEVGYCYKVIGITLKEEKKKFFVKVFDQTRLCKISSKNLTFSLKNLEILRNDFSIKNISRTVMNQKSELETFSKDYRIVIFNYEEGESLDQNKYSNDQIQELGRIIASIHKSTPNLDLNGAPIEKFDLHFEGDLVRCFGYLDQMEKIGSNEFQKKVKEIIFPSKKMIMEQLKKAKETGANLQAKYKEASSFVFCHQDPVGSNIISRSKEGDLVIIDWDAPTLAPREQDLWFFIDQHNFMDFLKSYQDICPDFIGFDPLLIDFYMRKRILEDITDWAFRILFEKLPDIQNVSDLNGLTRLMHEFDSLDNDIENFIRKIPRLLIK
ncbi:hypothetical protein M0811_09571 [Anaeramoeba ignava]|uniref:Aminoglycoside phosphotransferase domain-containing protein n=1 Tax=Anaeramoeba ignava TaxID=1746090 RepID=A0A9Q0R9R4_ANAIG|nr:hypothetical protein M0811_09571 [Anaeramoeba ignava]